MSSLLLYWVTSIAHFSFSQHALDSSFSHFLSMPLILVSPIFSACPLFQLPFSQFAFDVFGIPPFLGLPMIFSASLLLLCLPLIFSASFLLASLLYSPMPPIFWEHLSNAGRAVFLLQGLDVAMDTWLPYASSAFQFLRCLCQMSSRSPRWTSPGPCTTP